MNYIKEVNGFYDWLVYNPLPTGAIALWNALISINNKASWAGEFTVANLTLQAMTGLSRQGVDRARNDLINKGIICYKKGTSNKAGKYKMNSFECQKIGTEQDTKRTQNDTQDGHKVSTLYKLNKTKLNETIINNKDSGVGKVIDFYQNNISLMPSERELSQLVEWHDIFESAEIVIKAIDIAINDNARSIKYINAILQDWRKSNIRTIEDAEGYIKQRKERHKSQTQRKGGMSNGSTDTLITPGPSEETLRLERIAKEKGILQDGSVENIECDF